MPFSTANGLNSTISGRTMPLKKQCTHEGSSLEISKGREAVRALGEGSQVESPISGTALMRLLRSDIGVLKYSRLELWNGREDPRGTAHH